MDILTHYVLPGRLPAVSLLWFSEPDSAQHARGVGSQAAVSAIREADRQFGRVLSWLDDQGLSGETNVIVASDHGYSTISEVVEVEALLRQAGFPPGGVTVAPNGGSALFYTSETNARRGSTAGRLAEWLTAQRWCGALVASDAGGAIEGTLPASLIGLEGPRAPCLTMSFRWDSTPNDAGLAGHSYSTSLAPGLGQHGSMSPHETRNVLFARGPAFKQSATVTNPTGNVDLAPTILHLLGLPGGEAMHGRILYEALEGGPDTVDFETTYYQAGHGSYRQAITVLRTGKTAYVNEGQGGVK